MMVRLYKTKYRDKETRQDKTAKNWTIDFVDHLRRRRRWPLGIPNKRACEAIGDKINHLVSLKMAKLPPDREITEWIESIPSKLRDKLAMIGLISSERAAGGKALSDHVADFERSMRAQESTEKHAQQTVSRVKKILKGCKFQTWSDISATKVESFLKSQRAKSERFSTVTSDYYLKSIKKFCGWMIENGRAVANPLERAKYVDNGTDVQHPHSPLTLDEFRELWESTLKSSKMHYRTRGVDRAILYLTAVETGLRANELRQLTVSNFNFDENTVTVEAKTAKNRQGAVLPLKEDTAERLKSYVSGKLPTAKVFIVPHRTADMLKADLLDAGISYEADDGGYKDFHGLRHLTATLLAREGIHPSVAQQLMRHNDIRLTMQIYTHTFHEQYSQAIERLPDLTAPSEQQRSQSVMTGTAGTESIDEIQASKICAKILANICIQPRITMDNNEQQVPHNGTGTAFLTPEEGLETQRIGLGD